MSLRDFNTPHRQQWNGPIHHIIKAIDEHNVQYFKTGNIWHLQQAELLRKYIHGLKMYIHRQEGKLN